LRPTSPDRNRSAAARLFAEELAAAFGVLAERRATTSTTSRGVSRRGARRLGCRPRATTATAADRGVRCPGCWIAPNPGTPNAQTKRGNSSPATAVVRWPAVDLRAAVLTGGPAAEGDSREGNPLGGCSGGGERASRLPGARCAPRSRRSTSPRSLGSPVGIPLASERS
jgi:hypothetical protein